MRHQMEDQSRFNARRLGEGDYVTLHDEIRAMKNNYMFHPAIRTINKTRRFLMRDHYWSTAVNKLHTYHVR